MRLPRDEGAFKTIDAPSVLGELAFFDAQPRSATLDAVTDVEVVRLDIAAFDRLLEHEPELAHAMLRDLARDPRAAPADGVRGHRRPSQRLTRVV